MYIQRWFKINKEKRDILMKEKKKLFFYLLWLNKIKREAILSNLKFSIGEG